MLHAQVRDENDVIIRLPVLLTIFRGFDFSLSN